MSRPPQERNESRTPAEKRADKKEEERRDSRTPAEKRADQKEKNRTPAEKRQDEKERKEKRQDEKEERKEKRRDEKEAEENQKKDKKQKKSKKKINYFGTLLMNSKRSCTKSPIVLFSSTVNSKRMTWWQDGFKHTLEMNI